MQLYPGQLGTIYILVKYSPLLVANLTNGWYIYSVLAYAISFADISRMRTKISKQKHFLSAGRSQMHVRARGDGAGASQK